MRPNCWRVAADQDRQCCVFETHDGRTITGIVIRRNRKTVTIHTDDEKHWNVSPKLVRLTGRHALDGVASKDGRVVPFTKPGTR